MKINQNYSKWIILMYLKSWFWLAVILSQQIIETNIVKCHNSSFVDLEKQPELQMCQFENNLINCKNRKTM